MFNTLLPVVPPALQLVLGLTSALILASLFEYLAHRYVMHRGVTLPSFLGGKLLFRVQNVNHDVLHHGTYYRQFDREDDPVGREISIVFTREEVLYIMLGFSPFIIVLALCYPYAAIPYIIIPPLHNLLWNVVHRQMHQPQERAWARWRVYRFLARYHFLHHQNSKKNFNVVLPFSDLIFGTLARPTERDRVEMKRMGFL